MENLLIFVGILLFVYVGYKLWNSKKRNPSNPNMISPGVKDELDQTDKR